MNRVCGLGIVGGWRGAVRGRVGALAVLAVLCCPAAMAQGFGDDQGPGFGAPGLGGNPFLGAWSSQQPGPGGMTLTTAFYKPDGTYVMTSHLPNDTNSG